MTMVCAEPLAVVGEPGADMLIFGSGEYKVSVAVVSERQSVGGMAGFEADVVLDLGQSPFLQIYQSRVSYQPI